MKQIIDSKDFSIDNLKESLKEKSYFQVKFSHVNYEKTKEESEEEAREFGGNFKGTIIDMQTANMLVTVYDAMKIKEHKEKFNRMLKHFSTFDRLVTFGWSQVK